ncbi:MAG: ketopantoate reductase family protein [Planctomycetota bacterium]|jgi:ketopantoate reductase
MNERTAYTVFGAGSVGTVLAGFLASRGVLVALMGRGATSSIHLEGDDETIDVRVPVVDEPAGVMLLCVHESDAADVCARWPGSTVVTFQNGIAAEADAARTCDVVGGVWRMTCTLLSPGRALFTRRGRVVLGRWPNGIDDTVRAIGADLERAGLDVGLSPTIAADKWLKVLCNIGSTPNALVPPREHLDPRFGAIKAALVSEAWQVLLARGIEARSCDGRDASPEEEIERQRETGPRARPVYNDTWRQLRLGRPVKERYHRIIVQLGEPAPLNARMDELLTEATGPECYSIDALASALGWA